MPPSPNRNKDRVARHPDRGHYDTATVYGIIDDAMLCHIGFVQDEQPFVIPTLHARRGDQLLVHGASTSRLLRHIEAGHEVCVTITIVDGLVVAKSVFNQSVNYRSVVLFGTGTLIEGDDPKLQALEHLTQRLLPGVWGAARKPSRTELKATSIVSIAIEAASAKVRSGPPKDDPEDMGLPVWAGVLPIRETVGAPVPAEYTDSGMPIPGYVAGYVAQRNR